MATSLNAPRRSGPTPPNARANFALVALSLSVMAVALGVGAIVVPSVAPMLGIAVLVEAAGTFYFAKQAISGDELSALASRVRVSRALAVLGLVLAAVAIAPILF